MEYSVTRGTYAVTLYVFEFIALLVTTTGHDVHDVQYTRNVDRIKRRHPKIIPRCGRARLRGMPTTTLRRPTARFLMFDDDLLDISSGRAVYIAEERIFIDFANGPLSRPLVTEYKHPIVAIYEDVINCCTVFAHNLFDMIFIQLDQYEASFINISDLKFLTNGAEIFIRVVDKMLYITQDVQAYITRNHLVLRNGMLVPLRSMHQFISPEIEVNGAMMQMEWTCNRYENLVRYVCNDGTMMMNNVKAMFEAHLPYSSLKESHVSGYIIFSDISCKYLLYCQHHTGNDVPTIIDGVIVWLGHSYELLCGLIRAEKMTWYDLTPKLEYLVNAAEGTIFHNSRYFRTVHRKGSDLIIFTDKREICIPRPLIRIPAVRHYTDEIGQIRNIHHLVDGSVVFISGFEGRAFRAKFKFETVSQTADYNIVLDGITYYYRSGHLSNRENHITVGPFDQFKQIGQMVNDVFTLKYQGKHVAFREITDCQSEYAIAMIESDHFIAARIGGGDTIWEGHTIYANPAQRSKPALRDVQYDE